MIGYQPGVVMYLEHRSCQRDGWKFTYLGQDLVEPAKKLLAEALKQEEEARCKLTSTLELREVSLSSSVIEDLKNSATNWAIAVEQLRVWVHEFSHRLASEFLLSSSDVVYFNYPIRVGLNVKPPKPRDDNVNLC